MMRIAQVLSLAATAFAGPAKEFSMVYLDNSTFDMLVGHDMPAIVRFDSPNKKQDEEFLWVGKLIAERGLNILFASVIVEPSGEFKNLDVSHQFGLTAGREEAYEPAPAQAPSLAEAFSGGGKAAEKPEFVKNLPQIMRFDAGDKKGKVLQFQKSGDNLRELTNLNEMLEFMGLEPQYCNWLTAKYCNEHDGTQKLVEKYQGFTLEEMEHSKTKLKEERKLSTLTKSERQKVEDALVALPKIIKAKKAEVKAADEKQAAYWATLSPERKEAAQRAKIDWEKNEKAKSKYNVNKNPWDEF